MFTFIEKKGALMSENKLLFDVKKSEASELWQ